MSNELTRTAPTQQYRTSGLYRKIDEGTLDGRTTTAKLIQQLEKELQEYVGEVTIAAEMLIVRIIYKHLKLSSYENAFVENPKHVEAQHYLPLSNSLRLDLQTLAEMRKGGKAAPPDLHGD